MTKYTLHYSYSNEASIHDMYPHIWEYDTLEEAREVAQRVVGGIVESITIVKVTVETILTVTAEVVQVETAKECSK